MALLHNGLTIGHWIGNREWLLMVNSHSGQMFLVVFHRDQYRDLYCLLSTLTTSTWVLMDEFSSAENTKLFTNAGNTEDIVHLRNDLAYINCVNGLQTC